MILYISVRSLQHEGGVCNNTGEILTGHLALNGSKFVFVQGSSDLSRQADFTLNSESQEVEPSGALLPRL